MPIDLYYNPASAPSRAALITAKHLSIKFNEKIVNSKIDFVQLNEENYHIPSLNDNSFIVTERGAIMMYLVQKYRPKCNSLYPLDPIERAAIDRILRFDSTSYYPAYLAASDLILKKHKDSPEAEAVLKTLSEKLKILEQLLGEQPFLIGNSVTIADISLGASVPEIRQCFSEFWTTKLEDWYCRVEAALPVLKQINEEAEMNLLKLLYGLYCPHAKVHTTAN